MTGPAPSELRPPPEPSTAELQAGADYAEQRVALYRRRVMLGRGEPRRLAELERIAEGASHRLRNRQARAGDTR